MDQYNIEFGGQLILLYKEKNYVPIWHAIVRDLVSLSQLSINGYISTYHLGGQRVNVNPFPAHHLRLHVRPSFTPVPRPGLCL